MALIDPIPPVAEADQPLLMQIGTLSRRIEFSNRTIRRDLGYQPSN